MPPLVLFNSHYIALFKTGKVDQRIIEVDEYENPATDDFANYIASIIYQKFYTLRLVQKGGWKFPRSSIQPLWY